MPVSAPSLCLVVPAVGLLVLPATAFAADAASIVGAVDLSPADVVSSSTSGLFDQSEILEELGAIVSIDDTMALLSTGNAPQVTDGVDHDLGTGGFDPTDPAAMVFDQALLELEIRVPEGVHSLQFDWYFLSREYPFYVGTKFNDRFTVLQTGQEYEGNIVFDESGNVVDVNNALFTVTDGPSLADTGFWRESLVSATGFDGGGTGWVTTATPVAPGEIVSLRFDIHDVFDGVYDSAVLLDNFRWSDEEIDDPVSGKPIVLPIGRHHVRDASLTR